MYDKNTNRREFLERSIAGISLAGLPLWYAQEAAAAEKERDAARPGRIGPNDTIQIACIGPGGSKGGFRQGLGVTHGVARQPGVKCLAVCDVDRTHAEEGARSFGADCKPYQDFRDVLRRDDIDAVVIGTPDHWHTIIALAALKAGKHIYCEKPLTLTVDESKKISDAHKKSKRTFQTGSQQRSDGRFRMACELVRNGRIGKVRTIEARLPNGARGGPFQPKPTPGDFDFDFWLGPAPLVEYVPERTHGSFRHWYEYSGGMMTDWGAHHLDIAQWALGKDDSGPVQIESTGIVPAQTNGFNAAVDFTVTYTYPEGTKLIALHEGENGVHFQGDAGWIFVSRERIAASDPRLLSDPLPSSAERLYVSNNHQANFVDCIRSGKETICSATVGACSAAVCHLGNISLRLGGRKLIWDPEAWRFVNDDDANNMLRRPGRGIWKV